MKARTLLAHLTVGLLFLVGSTSQLCADITVRLSVKFILQPDGTRPAAGDIGTTTGFDNEVARGNGILTATARKYRLQVVEYFDIRPPVPQGQAADYWFNLPARNNRATIETAALADQGTWRWNASAINLYVNNSASGQCSFVGSGGTISLGNDIGVGTILHEIGHFFDLKHTHPGDPSCTIPPPYNVGDGDGLTATIPDHNCLTRDGLSMANFNGRVFSALNANEQTQVNSSWLNVMSYHQEDQLLEDQMDIWGGNANGGRLFACSGRTWFVAVFGLDLFPGTEAGLPVQTVSTALSRVQSGNDVILLRAGTYNSLPSNPINTACTLSATRGPVLLTRP
jgi:hypothetical protein